MATIRLASVLLFALPAFGQVALWGQCGGIGWSGSTTCASGAYCSKINDYYSQCLPGTQATTQAPPPTTPTPPPIIPSATVSSAPPAATSAPPSSGGTCSAPGTPSLSANTKLPDPFLKVSGGRVSTKADWACRRAEIFQLFQTYELGTLPGKPSTLTASFSGSTLTINCGEAGKSISFSVTITYPSSGTAPYPAIIAYGGLSIPSPAGVAVITFNNDDMGAQQSSTSRGQGKFYTLYGSGHTASAMTAWAWGVGRIIDALEITSAARINPAKVGVTGCSRNGKGAMVAGAFEPRLALTIPQESGSGGSACWRLSDAMKKAGKNVQTASQIITENVWFSKSFETFAKASVNNLPFDHHMLAGLVAPRGLYVIENTSQEWLGSEATYGCMKTAQKIYQALGVTDSMGFSQVGNHNHCAFPSSQQSELTAFINKFLLGQSTNTNLMKTDGGFTFNEATWIDWTVPTLS